MSKNPLQKTIALLLAALFWALPLTALPNPGVLGTIVASKDASLEGAALPNSGTIHNNDLLTTGPEGKALLSLSHAGRATLMQQTRVRFRTEQTHMVAEITAGSMAVESREGRDPVVMTSKYKIAPAAQEKTIYYVALTSDQSTVVAAQHGGIAITEFRSGRTYVLPEGQYASIPASALGVPGQPDAPQEESAKSPTGVWHIGSLSHKASVALVTAIAAGTTAAIVTILATQGETVSPSTP